MHRLSSQFSPRNRLGEAGFTPVAAMVGMAIVMISLFGFLQASSNLKTQDVRTNRRVQGEQLIASLAVQLSQMTSDNLIALCTSYGAYQATAPFKCGQTGDTLITTPAADPNSTAPRLGVRVNVNATNVQAGTTCVDLLSCKWRASNHILEVTLNGVWLVPPANSLSMRQLVFRKTR